MLLLHRTGQPQYLVDFMRIHYNWYERTSVVSIDQQVDDLHALPADRDRNQLTAAERVEFGTRNNRNNLTRTFNEIFAFCLPIHRVNGLDYQMAGYLEVTKEGRRKLTEVGEQLLNELEIN